MIAHVSVRTPSLFDPPSTDADALSLLSTGIAATVAETRSEWPGRASATVALSGCDLSCPYCFTPEHATRGRSHTSVERIAAQLAERRESLGGVVVSGGEPTSAPRLESLLEAIAAIGLPVKLDTSGSHPETLSDLLAARLVDFVSLDVKTTPGRYDRLTRGTGVWRRVERSIGAVLASGVDHEFRTTCYPFAVSAADLPSVAARLAGGRRYVLQQFVPRRTLDPAAASVIPIAPDELRRTAIGCSIHLPTIVRGV